MASVTFKFGDSNKKVCVGKWYDEQDNECVYICDRNGEYLACHEDGKHVFWHDTDEPWNWEMWYPVVEGEKVYLKSHFDTHMTCDDDDNIWQTDETDNVYLKMSQSDLDELTIEKEDDNDEDNDEEPVDKPKKKTSKSDDSDDAKPKRTLTEAQKKNMAKKKKIASIVKAKILERTKDEWEDLKGKELTKKKKEIYQKHKSENSDLYQKYVTKAEKEV